MESRKEKLHDALPWVEKYRPESLDDLVSHDEIISILNRLIDANKLPHLLFYGPPGTGKTSTILACARRLYGNNFTSMILELNASDDRGINVVRDQIKEFAGTKRLFSKGVKLIVLDEADSMTNEAQFALRRIIEKYAKNARFCLICNYVNKIIPALQSRCTKFRFSPLKPDQIRGRLEHVIELENINTTDNGREAILDLADGDMRRVLNLLQSTAMAFDIINEENVYLCSGSPLPGDIDEIFDQLMNLNMEECFNTILNTTITKGYALSDILKEITLKVMNIEWPPAILATLLKCLSDIEFRLARGCSDKLQLGSLISSFILARSAMST